MTMRKRVFSIGSLTLWVACGAFAASGTRATGEPSLGVVDPDRQAATEFAEARIELEARRAGGPRPGEFQQLLAEGLELGSHKAMKAAIKACEHGQLLCSRLLPAAQAGVEARSSGTEGSDPSRDVGLRQLTMLAQLQSMAPDDREAVLRAILTVGPDYSRFPDLTSSRAADIALWNDYSGLVEIIEKSRLSKEAHFANTALPIARALKSTRPTASLLRFVQEGVESELSWLEQRRLAPAAGAPFPQEIPAALAALENLRWLGDTACVRGLVLLLGKYSERKQRSRTFEQEGDHGVGPTGHHIPRTDTELGLVERRLAEVVGDLGNRDKEREVLGTTTLWDRVHDLESKRLQLGKLNQDEMLTVDP